MNTTASTIHRLSSCSLTGLNCSSSAVNEAFVGFATIKNKAVGFVEGESLSLSRRTERESQPMAAISLIHDSISALFIFGSSHL